MAAIPWEQVAFNKYGTIDDLKELHGKGGVGWTASKLGDGTWNMCV